jgi:hypothetical protein
VQAIVPADQQRRLQESAQARKREVRQLLSQMPLARNAQKRDLRRRAEMFLNQSDQAEQRGDMLQADSLAERTLALARELQSGR